MLGRAVKDRGLLPENLANRLENFMLVVAAAEHISVLPHLFTLLAVQAVVAMEDGVVIEVPKHCRLKLAQIIPVEVVAVAVWRTAQCIMVNPVVLVSCVSALLSLQTLWLTLLLPVG